MTLYDKSTLLILCGAINDIAEKTHEDITQRQLFDVRDKMEVLLLRDLEVIKALDKICSDS